ncbi:spore germination protein GerW family protein [Geodermatophilus marinus]|uniref:spore germination protein GerW family protein n=1 Tax=Geodermatophilus sp. LHW52908 TaxID=2303986 RepID=UPI000E3ECBE2|nr:spore germination protein GerW family protein [Geodermatophilus sp. LHW52908]RFU21638.1 sporulation protein [Geodermatophilus sp. LHW52908]
MKPEEVLSGARDAITVKRVFAEPYEKDGVTVIPAAAVGGAGGGGSGHDEKGQEGQGAGFGMGARPAGVYVIKDGDVAWRPAVDVNRLAGVVGLVLVTFFLTRSRVARTRMRARRRRDRGKR